MKKRFTKKRVVVCLLLFVAFGALKAQTVTESQATKVCQHFMAEKFYGKQVPAVTLREVITDENGESYLYRYSIEPRLCDCVCLEGCHAGVSLFF